MKNKTKKENNKRTLTPNDTMVFIREMITKSSVRCLSREIREMELPDYDEECNGKYWSDWYGKYCSIEFMKGLLSGVRKCDDNINTIIGFGDTISSMEDKCDGKD
mgnify:CR=1 FL=1